MAKFYLVFNDPDTDHLELPSILDPDTWKVPEGYRLEGYTDEYHLHYGDDDEPCAGWQADE